MATLKKRGKRAGWTIYYYIRHPETGKWWQRTQVVYGNKRQAEAAKAKLEAELVGGEYVEPTRQPLGEYLERWLNHYAMGDRSPRAVEDYRSLVRRHLDGLSSTSLATLTALGIQDHLGARLEAGASPDRVRKLYKLLRQALGQAVDWRLLPRNPTEGVRAPQVRSEEQHALTAGQAHHLLEIAEKHWLRPLVVVALYTGLRRGELLGLHWTDLELAAGRLHVWRALERQRGRGLVEGPPKTERSRRTLLLAPEAIGELAQLRRTCEDRLWVRQRVFVNEGGAELSPEAVSHRFRRLADRAGFPELRFHDLRHTYATLLLQDGQPVHVVSRMLGHSSAVVTATTYAHVLAGQERQAATAISGALDRTAVRPDSFLTEPVELAEIRGKTSGRP